MDPYVCIYLEQLNIPAKSKEMKQQQQQHENYKKVSINSLQVSGTVLITT